MTAAEHYQKLLWMMRTHHPAWNITTHLQRHIEWFGLAGSDR